MMMATNTSTSIASSSIVILVVVLLLLSNLNTTLCYFILPTLFNLSITSFLPPSSPSSSSSSYSSYSSPPSPLVFSSSSSSSSSSWSFVEAKNAQFLVKGNPFLFNGFNSYWMMTVVAQPSEKHKVTQVFEQAKATGLTVCRTWAFSDGSSSSTEQPLQISPGVYSEPVFQGLDFVISEARRNGIRLILTLTNNYKDFGGRPQYVSWARSLGIPVSTDDDFYTHPVLKWYYKNHINRVLTRINTFTGFSYKDDPTIMAWELINEPRCDVDQSGWVQEMASYVKSIDSNHLLAVGMEGFYGESTPDKKRFNPGYNAGTDFITSNLIQEIDFATIHAYPDAWLSGKSRYEQTVFMQGWMTSHLDDSRTILRKPLVFAEFGLSRKNTGYSIIGRDMFLSAIYGSIFSSARFGGTIAGGLVWQVLAEGMESYNDGYEIVLSQSPSTCFIIALQSRRMTALQHLLPKA
ncbi:Mannan endo-1,4-beta-mannosidase 5 [Linum perenne]